MTQVISAFFIGVWMTAGCGLAFMAWYFRNRVQYEVKRSVTLLCWMKRMSRENGQLRKENAALVDCIMKMNLGRLERLKK